LIREQVFESTITHMIESKLLTQENYLTYQDMFIDEYNLFYLLFDRGDVLKLYEILRVGVNDLYRIMFAIHFNINPNTIRSDIIRRILKEEFDFESSDL
jgi:hypothetical protein